MDKIGDWLTARRFNRLPVQAQIRLRHSGQAAPNQTGRLCIFSHYDPHGIVDPYVLHYLTEISRLGSDILFVSTAPSIEGAGLEKLLPICREIVLRTNISADFGSWNLGLHIIGESLSDYRQLILANDSVYGPFYGLASIFAQMGSREFDVWGLTESYEDAPHIQSYFLVFEHGALASPFFRAYWNSFRYEWKKRRLILTSEIGLSQSARKYGLRCEAWISSERVGAPTNSTLFFWDRLIEQLNFPFLKIEILRVNRFKSERALNWRAIIKAAYPAYDSNLIAAHLRRVGTAVPTEKE